VSEGAAELTGRAAAWKARGSYFEWIPPGTDAAAVEIFHVEAGDPAKPTVLLVHGFPTCSVDWVPLIDELSSDYYVCALDFPGYGFSAKPLGWGYGLGRDAALLDHYLAEIIGTTSAILVAHDRGTSVSLLHTIDAAAGKTRTSVDLLVLTNGNIFLPLSNLTDFQRLILNPETAPNVLSFMTPELLAAGMGDLTFYPSRGPCDEEVEALTATFAHDDGIKVLHETVQYLVERADHETDWLEALARLETPTTVIWGMNDPVSPVRVASYSWFTFLITKPGANRFYLVPDASHYLQNDRPAALAATIRHALNPDSPSAPGPIAAVDRSPVLIDRSRASIPAGQDVIRGSA
jgi:pimeloyl-ACP methyl ester carboxylesterase